MTSATRDHEIDVTDEAYLVHGATQLLARHYRPRGAGPFPMMIELHGGAWCSNDRLRDVTINEPLARSGVMVAALDFRMPPLASYPASVSDINYAVRWLKTNAARLGGDARRVGIAGTSSGGHLAALVAMKPFDETYSSLAGEKDDPAIDATVSCVVMGWPVIDPLGRYLYAERLKAAGGSYPPFVDQVLEPHRAYWQSEASMAEGSPLMILERAEAVHTPPMLCVQGAADLAHPRPQLDAFAARYRAAGGTIDVRLFDGQEQSFMLQDPASPASKQAMAEIVRFVHATLGGGAA